MGSRVSFAAPLPLADHHDLSDFDSGVAQLDDWLKRRARANQAAGASRCYVLCDGAKVIGYYALASGNVRLADAPGRFRRNMPDFIPVILLGRLAIDKTCQGKGMGRALIRDAALRTLQAAELVGVRGLLVHAMSEEARAFYVAVGLEPSPLDPMMLMATLDDMKKTVGLS